MRKNILLLIGVLVVIASCVLGYFTDIAGDLPTLIGTAFGLGIEIVAIWVKSEKKNGLVVAAIICAVIGGVCCAFAGLAEGTLTTLVSAIVGIIALLVSIFTTVITAKKVSQNN